MSLEPETMGAVNRQNATVGCAAHVTLAELERHVKADDFTLGQLSPGAWSGTLASFIEGPYAGLRAIPNGRLEPLALCLEVEFVGGARWSSPPSPRRAAGPELESLFHGTGGLYGRVLAATVRLQPRAQQRIRFSYAFPEPVALERTVLEALQAGCRVGTAAVAREKGALGLELELEGSRATLERDLGTFRRAAEAHGAIPRVSPTRLLLPRASTEERELTWGEVCRAAEDGVALELFRLSVDGVIARGETSRGVALGRIESDRWEHASLWKRILPSQASASTTAETDREGPGGQPKEP